MAVDDPANRERAEGLHPYAAGVRESWLRRLDDLPRPWVQGASWDSNCFVTARKLIELSNAGWAGYSRETAHADYLAHAPVDEAWDGRQKCWDSALTRAGHVALPEPEPDASAPTVTVLAEVPPDATQAEVKVVDPAVEEPVSNFLTGGSFILDTDPDPVPLWGRGQEVLWAEGEALTIVGGQGVGKTTLAQQIALGRCGFSEHAEVLGMPVHDSGGRVLYLAMDRPRQVARSFRRMVGEAWREQLDDRLRVWQGPPMADLAKNPRDLLGYALRAEADTIVVDSIKDAAIGLSDEEVGAGWNRARQIALHAGVEMIELHHNRKGQAGVRGAPSIDDVYGSTWITSGSGSVLLLAGAPGDPIVNVHHLKQPSEEVGPLKVVHDHEVGKSSIWHAADLVMAANAAPGGLTVKDAARLLEDVDQPSAAQREKARRRLERLASQGLLRVVDEGDPASGRPKRWGPC